MLCMYDTSIMLSPEIKLSVPHPESLFPICLDCFRTSLLYVGYCWLCAKLNRDIFPVCVSYWSSRCWLLKLPFLNRLSGTRVTLSMEVPDGFKRVFHLWQMRN